MDIVLPPSPRLHAPDLLTLPLNVQKEERQTFLKHQFRVCNSNMQDDSMQRSYVQQAASRKHALKLREYSTNEGEVTPGRRRRPNFHSSNNNKSKKMMTRAKHFSQEFTPRSRRYVHFADDEDDRYASKRRFQGNNSTIKGTKTNNNDNILIRSPIEGGGIGINHERSHLHNAVIKCLILR